MRTAPDLIQGRPVKPRQLTELVVIRSDEKAKADQYEYKGAC